VCGKVYPENNQYVCAFRMGRCCRAVEGRAMGWWFGTSAHHTMPVVERFVKMGVKNWWAVEITGVKTRRR
jgi:hypothetical protein